MHSVTTVLSNDVLYTVTTNMTKVAHDGYFEHHRWINRKQVRDHQRVYQARNRTATQPPDLGAVQSTESLMTDI